MKQSEVNTQTTDKDFLSLVAWLNGETEDEIIWKDDEEGMDEAIQFANTIGSLDRSVPDYADFDEVDPE